MITSFKGQYAFLSNFYVRPFKCDGVVWPTVEHYFQAMKFPDEFMREHVRNSSTASQAKRLGRALMPTVDDNEFKMKWDARRLDVMRRGVAAKFNVSSLGSMLLSTGSQMLIEGNTWGDQYWGMVKKDGKWKGENWLGFILMAQRAVIESD